MPSADETAEEEVSLCGMCSRPVTSHAVLCDLCNLWLHYECEILTGEEIEAIESSTNSYSCSSCCSQTVAFQESNPQTRAPKTAKKSEIITTATYQLKRHMELQQLPKTKKPPTWLSRTRSYHHMP
jgi:hypothetical protein